MACIKSAQRSALVAIAPDAPYLAAGTMAGAVDPSFSWSANLEIFKLDFQSDEPDLPLVAGYPSPDRFNRLSWSKPFISDAFSLGLIAGGLNDGSIGVWNPKTLISSEDQDTALVGRLEKHVGPVRGLEFSIVSPNMLASGAEEGELCIWDLEKPSEPKVFPSLKSVGTIAQKEVSFVSWNAKHPHILASTSYNGITVVWDLKQQKPVASILDPNRRSCSVVQWNPELSSSTELIIASDDDNSPSLRKWDVRKISSPVREFVGHTKGVMAMSWCPYDSSYLLTCAKDNRTICWDTHTGEIVSELPASTNCNFDVHWYPKIPGVFSASSFDVIGLYNIEACGRYTAGDGSVGSQSRSTAPKWLKCPTGASFGFGGKLVSFRSSPSAPNAPTNSPNAPTNSEVYVHELVTEHALVSRSTEFATLIKHEERPSLRDLCEKKSEESSSEEERETWTFLRVMFEEEGTARSKLLAHLGFPVPEKTAESTDDLANVLSETLDLDTDKSIGLRKSTDSSIFPDNGDDFFNNPKPLSEETSVAEETDPSNGKEEAKPTEEVQEVLEGSSSDPAVDNSIQRALIVGDYKGAVAQCLLTNRMADALVIAYIGGPSLWASTNAQYLKNNNSPYLKIIAAMVGNDLMTLVNTWPLNTWRETLALLCTFARQEEWFDLCGTLASRLLTAGNTHAATLCYICAGNIDKAIEIWSRDLCSEDGTKPYVDLLQDLMEKTITLTLATGRKKLSPSLSKLIEIYAELLASQGLLSTAMEYLELFSSDDASSKELTILRDRIAYSAEAEKVDSGSFPAEQQQPASYYVADQPNYGGFNHFQQHRSMSAVGGEGYQQPSYGSAYAGGYAPAAPQPRPVAAYQDYTQNNPVPSFQPAVPQNHMFVPSQPQFIPPPAQPSFGSQNAGKTSMKSFVPSNAPVLKNAEQYRQPTAALGSQLYSGHSNPTYQPSGPLPSVPPPPAMPGNIPSHQFVPPPAQPSFGSQNAGQTSMKSFVPSNAPVLKNPEQYLQPTAAIGSQLYSGHSNPTYQPSGPLPSVPGPTPPPPAMPGNIPSHQFPHAVTTNPPASRFTPVPGQQMPGQQFTPRPNLGGPQPSSPTLAPSQPKQDLPPPTMETVDTSKVSAEMRPVTKTLTRLFEETSKALGGPQGTKKREIADTSKKIAGLFVKLNSGDISPNAASKLVNLCSALDNGDFPSAMHIQVLMTTSDWQECGFWLSALKRMIRTRQSLRL